MSLTVDVKAACASVRVDEFAGNKLTSGLVAQVGGVSVAVAQWQGPEAGLEILESVDPPPWLLDYYLWDAVLGELHRRASHPERARHFIERALASAPTDAERELLYRRLASVLEPA